MDAELPLPPSTPAPLGPRRAARIAARVLVACRACGRQYDVSGLAAESRVRCACSAFLTVEEQKPHSPRPLVCGHCGGKLEDGARTCAYCSAEITLEERGLSGVCPMCLARLFEDARFCMECGVRIEPQAVQSLCIGASCPRCQSSLRSRALGSLALIECGNCAGLWLDPDHFEAICDEADKEELVRRSLGSESAPPFDASRQMPGYLACITCGDLMVRRNFGGTSGVIIDLCRGHGIWLDHRELERILDFVHGGGLMRAREREVLRLEARRARAREAVAPPLGTGGEGTVLFDANDDGSFLLDALRWISSDTLKRIAR